MTDSTIGQRLRGARERDGLTPEQFDKKYGDSMSASIVYFEGIEGPLDADEMIIVCRALRISPAWLLGLSEKTPESFVSDLITSPEWISVITDRVGVKQELCLMKKIREVILESHGTAPEQP